MGRKWRKAKVVETAPVGMPSRMRVTDGGETEVEIQHTMHDKAISQCVCRFANMFGIPHEIIEVVSVGIVSERNVTDPALYTVTLAWPSFERVAKAPAITDDGTVEAVPDEPQVVQYAVAWPHNRHTSVGAPAELAVNGQATHGPTTAGMPAIDDQPHCEPVAFINLHMGRTGPQVVGATYGTRRNANANGAKYGRTHLLVIHADGTTSVEPHDPYGALGMFDES